MKWSIPAKTFFLGEYVAMTGAPAIVLTTRPCFEVTLTDCPGLDGIHPESPAGRLWTEQGPANQGLLWHDPYHGCGGLGASSAQWLGAYYAIHHVQKKLIVRDDLLDAYFQSAWQGVGMRPSGYDVLAQSMHGCVYLDRQHHQYETYCWPFPDLGFILLHTGQKLATHDHLNTLTKPCEIESLIPIVESAKLAFDTGDSARVIDAVNAYHQALFEQDLVAAHSVELIASFKKNPDVLAIKGCGALGADVLLLLISANQLANQSVILSRNGFNILATSDCL